MSKEQIDELFSEYTRFSSQTSTTVTGIGLGMNITKRLVDLMQGEIIVESEQGKGSVFTIRIPQKQMGTNVCGPDLTEQLQSLKLHDMPISKRTQFLREYMPYGNVLVVDDVESNLYVAKGLLQPYGLKIETAINGYQVIEKIKDGNVYDIIFMDHMMPDMDGMETTKILRKSGYTGTIVALTANALIGRSEMFLRNGFDGFISKPIDSRELNYVLNEFIRNQKSTEVVEEARKVMEARNVVHDPEQSSQINSLLIRATIVDIEKALLILDDFFPEAGIPQDINIDLYTVTTHGMKSVMANINEMELSDVAHRLELAGSENNVELILTETPSFLRALRYVLERLKAPTKETVNTVSAEDKQTLISMLEEVKTACDGFNRRIAKKILDDIKKKEWPQSVNELLDDVSAFLLHGEFKKVSELITNSSGKLDDL